MQSCLLESLSENPECISDLAVTALDAPGAVLSGNPINVVCTITNIANSISSCTASGRGTATVTCAYSPTFQSNFSDYSVFDTGSQDLKDSFSSGDGQTDYMEMETNQGPGYYAMKVEVDAENESNASAESRNNSRAVVIRAD